MNILKRLREAYRKYDDNFMDPPKTPIALNLEDYTAYLKSLAVEDQQRILEGLELVYRGIPVVYDPNAPDFPEPL